MTTPTVSEAEFQKLWTDCGGSATEVAKTLGISLRSVFGRRRRIEKKHGPMISPINPTATRPHTLPPGRIEASLQDGIILIGSDAHVWPGPLTQAQQGFLRLASDLKPSIVVLNGDLFDGATVSRFPAGMWSQEKRPNVKQELEACQNFMHAVRNASMGAKHVWTWGNHDARFESRLAALTPEYEGVPGFALKDHFPGWTMCMSLWVNDSLVIKHRWHNGIHAVYNNALRGGKSIVTGHLHSLKVTPWTDWNGTRYGVDSGTLADADGKQFDYCEDNSRNWRAGGAVLTFRNGELLLPELFQVYKDGVQFRGRVLTGA